MLCPCPSKPLRAGAMHLTCPFAAYLYCVLWGHNSEQDRCDPALGLFAKRGRNRLIRRWLQPSEAQGAGWGGLETHLTCLGNPGGFCVEMGMEKEPLNPTQGRREHCLFQELKGRPEFWSQRALNTRGRWQTDSGRWQTDSIQRGMNQRAYPVAKGPDGVCILGRHFGC